MKAKLPPRLLIPVRDQDPVKVKTNQLCNLIHEHFFHTNPERSAELIWKILSDTNKLLLARQEFEAKEWLHG